MTTRVLRGAAASLLIACAWHVDAFAQARPAGYPARPLRIIVPVVPGGGLDMLSRAVGQMLTERWGQSVIVDNRPGGGTVLATEIAAKAAPDGYTFLAGTDTLRLARDYAEVERQIKDIKVRIY